MTLGFPHLATGNGSEVLQQVLESHSPGLQLLANGDQLLERPPNEVLTLLGHAFLAALSDHNGNALFRVILGEALRRPQVAEMLNHLGPSRAFTFPGTG
jgi:hypothetical protein